LNSDLFVTTMAAYGRKNDWDACIDLLIRMEAHGMTIDLDTIHSMMIMVPQQPRDTKRGGVMSSQQQKLWTQRLLTLEQWMCRYGLLVPRGSSSIPLLTTASSKQTPTVTTMDSKGDDNGDETTLASYSEQSIISSPECYHLRVSVYDGILNGWLSMDGSLHAAPRIEYLIRRPVVRGNRVDEYHDHPLSSPPLSWHQVPIHYRLRLLYKYQDSPSLLRHALMRIRPLVYIGTSSQRRQPGAQARYWQFRLIELEAAASTSPSTNQSIVMDPMSMDVDTKAGEDECHAAGLILSSQPSTSDTAAINTLAVIHQCHNTLAMEARSVRRRAHSPVTNKVAPPQQNNVAAAAIALQLMSRYGNGAQFDEALSLLRPALPGTLTEQTINDLRPRRKA
jgi:hypothetical protein